MRTRIQIAEIELLEYQRHLVERLEPIVARLDDNMVASGSGLTARRSGANWAVVLNVEASHSQVPGLGLVATPDQCILAFANAEIIECPGYPSTAPDLVDTVVSLTERYLSGVTVIEYFNMRGRELRTDYFYGLDSETDPACKIGTSSVFAFFRKVTRTVKHTHRFLRAEGAAEQRCY